MRNFGRYYPDQNREGIFREALVTNTKEAVEIASVDEATNTSEAANTYRTVLSSKGSLHKRVACSLMNAKTKKPLYV